MSFGEDDWLEAADEERHEIEREPEYDIDEVYEEEEDL